MTQLRDARFKRALDAAPDAQLRPDARVRAYIRDAARAAAPSRSVKWWKATGSGRPVWGAALASLALATLVTLLWYDREIPDAGVTPPSADKQAPVPVRPASSVAEAAQGQSPVAPQAAPAAAGRAKDVAKEAARSGTPSAGSSPDSPRRQDALRDQAAPALSKAAAPEAKAEAGLNAAPQAPAPAAAPAPAFAPPPPTAVQAPLAPSALAPSVTREAATVSRAGSAVIDDNWAEAMVQARGRSVRLQRAQADRLPALLNAVVRGPAAPPSAADLQPSLTIELTGPGSADTVDIMGAQVRYTRLRDGQPKAVTVLTPNAAQLQALQAEADRLLGR